MPVVEQKTNHHNNDDFTPAWRSLKIAKKKKNAMVTSALCGQIILARCWIH